MTYDEVFVLSLFDFIVTIILAKAIISDKEKNFIRSGIYVFIGAVLIGIITKIFGNGIATHVGSTIVHFVWIRFYSKRLVKDFKSYMIVYVFVNILLYTIQFLSVVILTLSTEFKFTLYYGVIAQIISVIIALLMWRFIPVRNAYIFIEQKNKWFQTVIINLLVLYYILSIMWYIDVEGILQSMLSVFILLLVTVVLNTFILKNGLVSQSNKEKLQIYETYLPIINDIIDEIRVKQHDYHNHLQAISSMKSEVLGNNTDVKVYIEQVLQNDIWSELIKINNKVIMAFLYSKYKNAKEEEIIIKYSIKNYLIESNYTDYELVEMYGILIDNAIEATRKTQRNQIEVAIDILDGMNIFEICNPSAKMTSASIKNMFKYHYTTKEKEGHGIGLKKLNELLEKKKGTIRIYYDADYLGINIQIAHY